MDHILLLCLCAALVLKKKKKKHVLFFPPVVVFPPACGQQAGDAAAPPEERGEASGADGGVCSHQTSRRIPEGGEMETTGDRRRAPKRQPENFVFFLLTGS